MGRTVEVVSQGESFQVDAHDRSYQGAIVPAVFKVSGDVTPGAAGQVQMAAAPAIAGATQQTATNTIFTIITAGSSTGSISVTGAKVGDKVVSAIDLTAHTNVSADFESTISVAGHIQQTTGTAANPTLILILQQS